MTFQLDPVKFNAALAAYQCDGMTVVTGDAQDFIVLMGGFQQADHVRAYNWHIKMMAVDCFYLDRIAARQAEKRAAGIGQEGRCPR